MMKKIVGLMLLVLGCASGFAQYPVKQSIGSKATEVFSKGILRADSGYVQTVFSDTTAANQGYIKNIAGITIRVADTVYFRNAATTKWLPFHSVAGTLGWSLAGNEGTTPSNFIGTTDEASMRIKTNDIERIYIDSLTGNVGINRTPINPISSYKLEVGGTGSLGKFVSDIGFTELRFQNTNHTSNIGDYLEGLKFYSNSNSIPALTMGPNTTIGDTAGTAKFYGPLLINTYPNNVGINIWKGADPSLDANTGLGVHTLDSLRRATVDLLTGVLPDTATVGAAFQSQYNTAIGANALENAKYCSDNTAVGAQSLQQNIDGFYNVGVGHHSLRVNIHGWKNTSIGTFSLFNNVNGTSNTALGFRAMRGNVNGNYNTVSGEDALYADSIGMHNSVYGYYAVRSGYSGSYNSVFGSKAGNNISGNHNSIFGYLSAYNLTTGTNNIIIGDSTAITLNTGSNNTIIGGSVNSISSSLSNNIILADGAGNIKAQHTGTNWLLTGRVGIDATPISAHKLSVAGRIGGDTYGDSYVEFPVSGHTIVSANNDVRLGYSQTFAVKQTGEVGIGTTSPDASAVLDIASTTKGLLIPRLTNDEMNAVSSPATGLQIFNTTNSAIYFYDGSAWRTMANIYVADGTLTGKRTLTGGGNSLRFTGLDSFTVSTDVSTYNTTMYLDGQYGLLLEYEGALAFKVDNGSGVPTTSLGGNLLFESSFGDKNIGGGASANPAEINFTGALHPVPATQSVKWLSGSGTPEGSVQASVGSLYTRTDGGAGTTLYVKESGSNTTTGWVAK